MLHPAGTGRPLKAALDAAASRDTSEIETLKPDNKDKVTSALERAHGHGPHALRSLTGEGTNSSE